MKKLLVILFMLASAALYAQKTSRLAISEMKGLSIIASITEQDTLFMMFGQNAKYKQIINTITVKHGTLADINDLLNECMKFLPEPEDTSLQYKGNTILSMGNSRLMVFAAGRDSNGYVLLNKTAISKLQGDIGTFIKREKPTR